MTLRISDKEIFGRYPSEDENSQSVYRVKLRGGGLTANILTWGAVLQDLRLEGHEAPLVLGFDRFEHYEQYSHYFGATVGRFANRIGAAQFEIDGEQFNTDPNDRGKHTLHGGSAGTHHRNWQIADLGTSHVYLTLDDPAGMMGFPGNCQLFCNITLKDNGVLHIEYTTRTDAPTIASLAHHSYFALDDGGDIRTQSLEITADTYLPVDDELIPTGEIANVENTPFDFRSSKYIGRDLEADKFYDHNFCLAENQRGLQDVAQAHSEQSNVTLSVATTEPGLQFFDARSLDIPVPGLAGEAYGPYAGFCLETQMWPDAINHAHFPSPIVRPQAELRQVTEYRFTHG